MRFFSIFIAARARKSMLNSRSLTLLSAWFKRIKVKGKRLQLAVCRKRGEKTGERIQE
jgi:hypothetical protein